MLPVIRSFRDLAKRAEKPSFASFFLPLPTTFFVSENLHARLSSAPCVGGKGEFTAAGQVSEVYSPGYQGRRVGGGIVREFGIEIYTLLYLK